MLLLTASLLTLALAASPNPADEGQGTARPGANLAQLNIGSQLLGPRFDPSEQLGRVVVLEIGGS